MWRGYGEGVQQLDPIATYLAISDRERAADGLVEQRAAAAARLAGARPGAAVLDLGAGQGWYSLALARRFTVVGVDRSTGLVAEARRRARRLAGRRRPHLLVGHNEALPVPDSSVDAAISLATCIGYGSEDDDRAAFEELRRVLQVDAKVVLEAVSAERAARSEERERWFPDGAHALYSPNFDSSTQVLSDTQSVELPDGSSGVFRYSVRAYDPSELLNLIEDAGLVCDGMYGSTSGARPTPGDPIVVVARSRSVNGRGVRAGRPRSSSLPDDQPLCLTEVPR